MRDRISPAVGFRAGDELLGRVKIWALGAARRIGPYAEAAVAGRLVQRVADFALLPFIETCEPGRQPGPAATVRCGGLVIRMSDGRTGPELVTVMRSACRFMLTWLEVLAVCGRGIVRRGAGGTGPAALLLRMWISAVRTGDDDRRFAEFCRFGPVEPLRKATRILVQMSSRLVSTEPERIRYTSEPLFELARAHRWSLGEFLQFLGEHVRVVISYAAAVTRCRLACLLAQDLAEHAMVAALNRRGLIEAVVMPHHVLGQQLWLTDLPGRRFAAHMVWFSADSTPLAYASDGVRADHPHFRDIRVDASWVWTKEFGARLKAYGVAGAMNVVGPILWYLPEEPGSRDRDSEVRIAVFGVTPVKPEIERKLRIVHENYYRTECLLAFLEDILAARVALEEMTGKRVLVLLKPKRPYEPIHDPRYIAFVDQLSGSGLTVLPPETNVFSLIRSSDVVVVIPYSSPAYVASHLGTPAVYYDPTGELLPNYQESPWIRFAAGRENLVKMLAAALETSGEHSF